MFNLQTSFKTKLISLKSYNHVQARNHGWFEKIPMAKPDAVFGIVDEFKKDTNKNKVNLSIGIYRTDDNKPYVLKCVRKAEEIIMTKDMDKEYTQIDGSKDFKQYIMDFTFGKDCDYNQPGRNVTLQVLSGCGGLSVTAQFLKRCFPGKKEVYISNPTWPNHYNVFNWQGIKTKSYRYYDAENIALDFKGMMEDIHCIPNKSMILFHAAAHNPTGFDPSADQWAEIAELVKKKKLYVIMDNAYQGFATGSIENDSRAFRIMAKERIPLAICTSFSKNMGLYGERVGATSFLVDCKEEADKLLSQLLLVLRANHSNPPLQGARILQEIFSNSYLKTMWQDEIKLMSNRMFSARTQLLDLLKKSGSKRNWDFLTKQIGMFAYTGLTGKQIERLKKEFHIFVLTSSRIAVSGINSKNVEYVAKAFHEVTS